MEEGRYSLGWVNTESPVITLYYKMDGNRKGMVACYIADLHCEENFIYYILRNDHPWEARCRFACGYNGMSNAERAKKSMISMLDSVKKRQAKQGITVITEYPTVA